MTDCLPTYHIRVRSLLLPYLGTRAAMCHSSRDVLQCITMDGSRPTFSVQWEILDWRRRERRVQSLVRWEGYGHEHDSWEPVAHFEKSHMRGILRAQRRCIMEKTIWSMLPR